MSIASVDTLKSGTGAPVAGFKYVLYMEAVIRASTTGDIIIGVVPVGSTLKIGDAKEYVGMRADSGWGYQVSTHQLVFGGGAGGAAGAGAGAGAAAGGAAGVGTLGVPKGADGFRDQCKLTAPFTGKTVCMLVDLDEASNGYGTIAFGTRNGSGANDVQWMGPLYRGVLDKAKTYKVVISMKSNGDAVELSSTGSPLTWPEATIPASVKRYHPSPAVKPAVDLVLPPPWLGVFSADLLTLSNCSQGWITLAAASPVRLPAPGRMVSFELVLAACRAGHGMLGLVSDGDGVVLNERGYSLADAPGLSLGYCANQLDWFKRAVAAGATYAGASLCMRIGATAEADGSTVYSLDFGRRGGGGGGTIWTPHVVERLPLKAYRLAISLRDLDDAVWLRPF